MNQQAVDTINRIVTHSMTTMRIPEDFILSVPAMETLVELYEIATKIVDDKTRNTCIQCWLQGYAMGMIDGERSDPKNRNYIDMISDEELR